MPETAHWPFGTDAAQDDPLTALRIPVVASFNPMWKYVAAYIDVDRSKYSWGSQERPLDVDSGCNTTIFVKYGVDDWGYRRCSWEYGPIYVPVGPKLRGGKYDEDKQPGPLTLVQVMDRCHTVCDEPMQHWLQWKTDHPEVFPT